MVNEPAENVRKTNPDVIKDVFFTKGFPISDMKILLNRLLEEGISILILLVVDVYNILHFSDASGHLNIFFII